MFLMPTLIEEEACVFSEIWVRMSRIIKIKMSFFGKFGLSVNWYKREKNEFLVGYTSVSAAFSIQILMAGIELVLAEN